MKYVRLMLALFCLNVLALAQNNQETKAKRSPEISQAQILELPLTREMVPLVLFERALRDEKGRCLIHHLPLKVSVIPVFYGLRPGMSSDYYEVERREFPNAVTFYEGGCVVSAKEAKVLQCPKCLQARRVWEKTVYR